MLIDLTGQIERVTFNNEENGFTIAKLKVSGRRDLVTVVGTLMAPTPGEVVQMKGEWSQHPKFGEQFKVSTYKSVAPATAYGIRKYLGSGLIKGLGPVMAERIVKKFSTKTLDVIENKIGKLAEVEGIGKKRIAMIKAAWDEQRDIREVMLFLQSHGVSTGHATKIFRHYRDRSIAAVRQNPYRLASEIFGIGFLTADRIADKLGFAKDSSLRAESGILYTLERVAEEGHVYFPYESLVEKCRKVLEVSREVIVQAMGTLTANRKIIIEDLNTNLEEFRINHKAVYLIRYNLSEAAIADRIKALVSMPKSIRRIDSERAVVWVQQQLQMTLAQNQVAAVRSALENKVMVITGGPGTGKTTITHAILKIFSRLNKSSRLEEKILLAAPTGRAAKRLSETTGRVAKTIHRLLEFSFQKGGFQRDSENPLNCDLLIVDEASMIDTVLMYYLLKAVPDGATLILVGDVNQLPSVGAGNVLNDIIASGCVPVVELNEIFRQARASRIVVSAHQINNGVMPPVEFSETGSQSDFFFIEQEDPGKVLEIILELVGERIPRRFNIDPVDDIQVLTPMHKGIVGAGNLNTQLQGALNPVKEGIIRGEKAYRVGDKVMQIRNNYDREVFNGDIGRIKGIFPDLQEMVVMFDGREVVYEYTDLDEIVLAYAISVHKSQGSEYPAIVIPILTQHYILLQRNLIYTAVTRGRELVVVVGTRKAMAIGIKNDKPQKRHTFLKHRLAELFRVI
jgi:exodeoxyribonuclease V alpha subunit